MGSTKADHHHISDLTIAKKRRIRRKKAQISRNNSFDSKSIGTSNTPYLNNHLSAVTTEVQNKSSSSSNEDKETYNQTVVSLEILINNNTRNMSSKEDVLATREAKKLAKHNAKLKAKGENLTLDLPKEKPLSPQKDANKPVAAKMLKQNLVKKTESPKGKDEVDRALVTETKIDGTEKTKEEIQEERAAKKLAKQAKKKGADAPSGITGEKEMTNKEVAETLKNIVEVAKEVQQVSAKVNELMLKVKPSLLAKPDEGKSKAILKAERRAKQEMQRAAKVNQPTVAKAKPEVKAKEVDKTTADATKEMSPKPKALEKAKTKSQLGNRINWFQHLHTEKREESLRKLPLNSSLHPAIIKLGVQLSSGVVKGSNARCIALLNALKQMVSDFILPAKTEFARGLEAHLAASLEYLWRMRQPSASQTNAVKYFRFHLTQLPNNVDEFDAKKTLQGEIDRYIREQIEMAGEAISIAVRNKISDGDTILTYGCSSLIERILCDAWASGVKYRCVLVGDRVCADPAEMRRRLTSQGVPVTCVDISALSFVMNDVNKVVLGACSVLANGSVLGAAGSTAVALVARSCNVPTLVCCETHKFSERVHTDAFVYNELGDPDDLIDPTNDNSPLKDWRSNPNLTLLNLKYDVTPASLVTAVVTELAILPCTSAPVVLRFKLSEYGI